MSLIDTSVAREAADFFMTYTGRDPETKVLGLHPDRFTDTRRKLDAGAAIKYLPHLQALSGTRIEEVTLPLDHRNQAADAEQITVKVDPLQGLGVTSSELAAFTLALELLAETNS